MYLNNRPLTRCAIHVFAPTGQASLFRIWLRLSAAVVRWYQRRHTRHNPEHLDNRARADVIQAGQRYKWAKSFLQP